METDKKNCWSDKTPLETGLLLILAVAIPFLIIVIIVYILSPILCVNCSTECSEVCHPSANSRPPSPADIESRAIKLESAVDVCSYSEHEGILKDLDHDIDSRCVASIIEDVYEDDFSRQRYLCAAAIVTFKWVVTGSICFEVRKIKANYEERIFVRAGSSYWSKGGSVHEIQQILFANDSSMATIAAVKLKEEFPKFLSIVPIPLSSSSSFRKSLDEFEMYDWKSNDSLLLPLMFRKKYVTLAKQRLIALPDPQCKIYSKNENLFCALPEIDETCSNYSFMSFPVTKSNILFGVQSRKICDTVNNITVHLIFDTTSVLSWLQDITQS